VPRGHLPLVFVLAAGAPGCARRPLPPPSPLFPATVAWTVVFPEPVRGLAADGPRVFALTGDGIVHALSADSGAVLWSVPRAEGALSAGEGLLLLRQDDGTLWRLDPETGDARWKVDSGVPGARAAQATADGVVLVAGQGLAALEAGDGAKRWTQASSSVLGTATGPQSLIVSEEGGVVRRRDARTGASVWEARPGGTTLATAVVGERGHVLLGGNGRAFTALDLEDGSREWRWKIGASVEGAPVLVGGRVLFATLEGVLYALGQGNGHMAWRADLPSRPMGGPVLVGTAVLVPCHGARPDESVVIGFDGRTGAPLGSVTAPAEVRPPIVVQGGRLFLALRDRRVTAVALRVS
jgi:outer membrane protein assembly factor BamB